MNWLITTGAGLTPHSVHGSLDAALQAVHREILRGRPDFDSIKYEAFTGDDNGVSDGTLTMLSWYAPSRKMTDEDILQYLESGRIDKRTARGWKKIRPNVTDWESTHKMVQFVGEPVEIVSICREDRHRQYLARAGQLNDVSDRLATLNEMTKTQPVACGRRVLPQKGQPDA